ncbi:MAG: hypothetical protein SGILL_000815 [Bacillariaceae sp.]
MDFNAADADADADGAKTELLDESLVDFRDMLYDGKQVPKVYPKVVHSPTDNNNNTNSSSNNSTTMNTTSAPLQKTTPSPTIPELVTVDKREPGVVYLDIKENQFDGKMTTWFQFAALVGDEFPEIDYAAKVDSDLLLFTPNFFDYMQEQHDALTATTTTTSTTTTKKRMVVTQVYGGVEFPATNCVVNFTFDHACPLPLVGPSYMSGELNFMSMDLARYIVSDDCPREELTIPHEDVSLSNYVYSYTTNVAYHEKIRKKYGKQRYYPNDGNANVYSNNHTIDLISINNTRILITPSLTADWTQINLRTNTTIFSKLLWGHSIRRGDHRRYLVFKKDRTFRTFWERFVRAFYSGWKQIGGGGRGSRYVGGRGGGTANGVAPQQQQESGRTAQVRGSLIKRMELMRGIKRAG